MLDPGIGDQLARVVMLALAVRNTSSLTSTSCVRVFKSSHHVTACTFQALTCDARDPWDAWRLFEPLTAKAFQNSFETPDVVSAQALLGSFCKGGSEDHRRLRLNRNGHSLAASFGKQRLELGGGTLHTEQVPGPLLTSTSQAQQQARIGQQLP